MNWKIFLGLPLWIALFMVSCRKDEISFEKPALPLVLSQDTIVLDTVYQHLRSSTYTLKIFNQEDKDVKIPKIFLGQGASSQYRINVDGRAGYSFENVPIRAKDSLFVFIEIAPNINSRELVVEDQIKVENGIFSQQVTLLSVVQDAEFLVSTKDNPKILQNDTSWNDDKVKIVLGEVQLAEGKSLTINENTKVYFMPNSGLKINQNATLNVNGDLGREVIFRGHRNEPRYDTLPKNWDAIKLEKDALLNMNYAKIFGGTTGLRLDHARANVKNTMIHTFQEYGIFAINTRFTAENLVMNNAGIANIGIAKGGHYDIAHATLANFWVLSHHSALAIFAQNSWRNPQGVTETADFTLNFKNSIAYTQKDNAIQFVPSQGSNFQYLIENSLVKFGTNSGFVWDNNPLIVNSIKNQNPLFVNPFITRMNLLLKENSPVRAMGNTATANAVPLDIKKVSRTHQPNMGAYQ